MNSGKVLFFLVCMFYGYSYFQRTTLAVMNDDLQVDFDSTSSEIGLLASTYFWAYALVQIPYGSIFSRSFRYPLAFATAISSVGALVFAISPSLSVASFGRVLVGIGCGGGWISGVTVVNLVFPDSIASSIAIMIISGMTAGWLGQAPFGALCDLIGWRVANAIVALWPAIICPLIFVFGRKFQIEKDKNNLGSSSSESGVENESDDEIIDPEIKMKEEELKRIEEGRVNHSNKDTETSNDDIVIDMGNHNTNQVDDTNSANDNNKDNNDNNDNDTEEEDEEDIGSNVFPASSTTDADVIHKSISNISHLQASNNRPGDSISTEIQSINSATPLSINLQREVRALASTETSITGFWPITKSLWINFLNAIKKPVNLVLALHAFCAIAGHLAIANMWSIPYLEQIYGFSSSTAALAASMSIIGAAFGAPTLGRLSDRFKMREGFMIIQSLSGLCAVIIYTYVTNLPDILVFGVLTIMGFMSPVNITFATVTKYNNKNKNIAAVASSFVNMCIMMSGAIFQMLIGTLLDEKWEGAVDAEDPEKRIYPRSAYEFAFTTVIASYFIAVSCAILLKFWPGRRKSSKNELGSKDTSNNNKV
eukprot:TRINITY_DN920_c0_g1_i2.p1 TRINITY_DN920_c0_g1~~TRINITY_DN920_c0_g1_i2.p1  ORF type:complete len:595 (-),score=153.30 TRINITY_DN920_c0_g1_i2:266-2050(-)